MADIYVDTSAATNGDGSIGNPYNIWSDAYIADGNNVYVRRGTTIGGVDSPSLSAGSVCLVSSYGEGAAPIINAGGASNAALLTFGRGLTFEGFELTNYSGDGIFADFTPGITVKDIVATGGQRAVRFLRCSELVIDGVDATGCSNEAVKVHNYNTSDASSAIVNNVNSTDCPASVFVVSYTDVEMNNVVGIGCSGDFGVKVGGSVGPLKMSNVDISGSCSDGVNINVFSGVIEASSIRAECPEIIKQ